MAKPEHGFGRIGSSHAHASEGTRTEAALRLCVARLGSLAEEGHGLPRIDCNACAVEVDAAENALRTAVAPLCSQLKPGCGLHHIGLDACAVDKADTEVALRFNVARLGSPQKPRCGLSRIDSTAAGAVAVVDAEEKLRIAVACLCGPLKPHGGFQRIGRHATALLQAARGFVLGSRVASVSRCVIELVGLGRGSLALELMDAPVLALARGPAVVAGAASAARQFRAWLVAARAVCGRHEACVVRAVALCLSNMQESIDTVTNRDSELQDMSEVGAAEQKFGLTQ